MLCEGSKNKTKHRTDYRSSNDEKYKEYLSSRLRQQGNSGGNRYISSLNEKDHTTAFGKKSVS